MIYLSKNDGMLPGKGIVQKKEKNKNVWAEKKKAQI